MQTSWNSRLKSTAAIAAACLAGAGVALGGCGLRGPLVMPKEDVFPQAAVTSTDTAPAESGQGKPEGAAPKPHRPFVLDGLIR